MIHWANPPQDTFSGLSIHPLNTMYDGTHSTQCTMGHTQHNVRWDTLNTMYDGTHSTQCTMGHTQHMYNGTHSTQCTMGHTQHNVRWDTLNTMYDGTHSTQCTMGHTQHNVRWDTLNTNSPDEKCLADTKTFSPRTNHVMVTRSTNKTRL